MKRVGFDVEGLSERTKTKSRGWEEIQYDKIGIYKVKSIICVFMTVIIKSEAVRC